MKELELRQDYFGKQIVETIYFGGGTPSLLEIDEIRLLLEKIRSVFPVAADAEITLEVNPDDVNEDLLAGWKETGINRLSLGIQSFFEEDLRWMNRAHDVSHAVSSLQAAVRYFDNITVDLIYGTPFLTNEKWKQNVEKLIRLNIPHLSCYALTVEPKTPLQKMISAGKMQDVDADKQSEQFVLLMQWMEKAGYEHYEISNFARPGYRSRHNSSYWSAGVGDHANDYLGVGPSAHSFNGNSRQWNISNNTVYIDSITKGIIPCEKEELTPTQKTNEYIMTSLRTIEGLDLNKVDEKVGERLIRQTRKYVEQGLLLHKNGSLILTKEGKLLADGIAADLFS